MRTSFERKKKTVKKIEVAAGRCSLKKVSQNSEENTCAGVFFDKVADWRPATLSKIGCSIRVFLWIFKDFQQHILKNTHGWLLLKNEQL